MRIFGLNKVYSIVCEAQNTRNGFRHVATLMQNGNEVDGTKLCYLNRTWESFTYQSVLEALINKTTWLTDKEKRRFIKKINNDR